MIKHVAKRNSASRRQSLTSFVSKKLTLVTFGAVLTAFLFNGCGGKI